MCLPNQVLSTAIGSNHKIEHWTNLKFLIWNHLSSTILEFSTQYCFDLFFCVPHFFSLHFIQLAFVLSSPLTSTIKAKPSNKPPAHFFFSLRSSPFSNRNLSGSTCFLHKQIHNLLPLQAKPTSLPAQCYGLRLRFLRCFTSQHLRCFREEPKIGTVQSKSLYLVCGSSRIVFTLRLLFCLEQPSQPFLLRRLHQYTPDDDDRDATRKHPVLSTSSTSKLAARRPLCNFLTHTQPSVPQQSRYATRSVGRSVAPPGDCDAVWSRKGKRIYPTWTYFFRFVRFATLPTNVTPHRRR